MQVFTLDCHITTQHMVIGCSDIHTHEKSGITHVYTVCGWLVKYQQVLGPPLGLSAPHSVPLVVRSWMRLPLAVRGRQEGGERGRRKGKEAEGRGEWGGRGIKGSATGLGIEGKTDIHVHCSCMIVQLYLKCLRGRFMQSLVAELTVPHQQHHNLRRGRRRGAGEGNKIVTWVHTVHTIQ